MKNKILIISSMLLLSSCNSVLNPFKRVDTVENYKTRQDLTELKSVAEKTKFVATDLSVNSDKFIVKVKEPLAIVLNEPTTHQAGLSLQSDITDFSLLVKEGAETIKKAQEFNLSKTSVVYKRHEPKLEVSNWLWWVLGGIVIFVLLGAVGGLPLIAWFVKWIAKKIGARLAGELEDVSHNVVKIGEAIPDVDNRDIKKKK